MSKVKIQIDEVTHSFLTAAKFRAYQKGEKLTFDEIILRALQGEKHE